MQPDVIDYAAVAEQLQRENERLRLRILALRQAHTIDLGSYWYALLDALEEPKYQILLMVAVPILLTLVREVFRLIQRRKRNDAR
jgi:hypothetical protein